MCLSLKQRSWTRLESRVGSLALVGGFIMLGYPHSGWTRIVDVCLVVDCCLFLLYESPQGGREGKEREIAEAAGWHYPFGKTG